MSKIPIKIIRLITSMYDFRKKNRTVIKAFCNKTGVEHHVGLRFVNILRKKLSSRNIIITNQDIYTIIIQESKKKHD